MKKHNYKNTFLVFGVLSILWMTVIFLFSNCNADSSSEQSSLFADMLIRFFYPDFTSLSELARYELIQQITHPIRKSAHFTIYMILGIFTYFFFYYHNKMRKTNFPKPYLLNVPVCFLYACSDEFHQLFIAGRSGNFTDILIDTAGSILSTFIIVMISLLVHKASKNKGLSN